MPKPVVKPKNPLANLPIPKKQLVQAANPTEPLWQGPEVSGITFSLLSRFLVCRHRFWIQVIQGLREDEGFNIALEFGSLFHAALEAHEGKQPWEPSIQKYYRYLLQEYSGSEATITKWYKICKMLFPLYTKHYQQHHETVHGVPVMQEQQFRIPIKLPSGRIVHLRGKFDSVHRIRHFIYLQENKTKGNIDIEGIQKTVDQNLQTMIYQIALREALKNGGGKAFDTGTGTVVDCPGATSARFPRLQIAGNIYNVVRRPLSEKYAIRPKKDESDDAFIKRLQTFIQEKQASKQQSEHYFYRWQVPISSDMVDNFARHCLFPLLEQVCDWWESIRENPFDPWHTVGDDGDQVINQQHWRLPYGIYNSIYGGFRGDYFNYLSTGSRAGLRQIDNLFPELEEHV